MSLVTVFIYDKQQNFVNHKFSAALHDVCDKRIRQSAF